MAGLGPDDVLLWTNTVGGDVARYTNWERFVITDGSELTFANFATLTPRRFGHGNRRAGHRRNEYGVRRQRHAYGGAVHQRSIRHRPQLGRHRPHEQQLQTPPTGSSSRAIISAMAEALTCRPSSAADGSPSDQLVINSGRGSGSTSILVTNVGGPGALTIANGILVVDAANGATTDAGAFTLGGIVAAGPFEYSLFRGGVTPASETDNDWFLRNTVSPPPCRHRRRLRRRRRRHRHRRRRRRRRRHRHRRRRRRHRRAPPSPPPPPPPLPPSPPPPPPRRHRRRRRCRRHRRRQHRRHRHRHRRRFRIFGRKFPGMSWRRSWPSGWG